MRSNDLVLNASVVAVPGPAAGLDESIAKEFALSAQETKELEFKTPNAKWNRSTNNMLNSTEKVRGEDCGIPRESQSSGNLLSGEKE